MIKLHSILREVRTPKYLYHATYRAVLDSIRKYGLDNTKGQLAWQDSKRGVVYLASDPYEAESYAETSEDIPDHWTDDIIIFKVDIRDLDSSKLRRDRNVIDGETTFEYHGIIPYDILEEV